MYIRSICLEKHFIRVSSCLFYQCVILFVLSVCHLVCFIRVCHLVCFIRVCHLVCFIRVCHLVCFIKVCHLVCFIRVCHLVCFIRVCHLVCFIRVCHLVCFIRVCHLIIVVVVVVVLCRSRDSREVYLHTIEPLAPPHLPLTHKSTFSVIVSVNIIIQQTEFSLHIMLLII